MLIGCRQPSLQETRQPSSSGSFSVSGNEVVRGSTPDVSLSVHRSLFFVSVYFCDDTEVASKVSLNANFLIFWLQLKSEPVRFRSEGWNEGDKNAITFFFCDSVFVSNHHKWNLVELKRAQAWAHRSASWKFNHVLDQRTCLKLTEADTGKGTQNFWKDLLGLTDWVV